MKITKTSLLTGKVHTQDIPITDEQLILRKSGELIQNVMPNLTDDQREFLISGATAEEWDSFMDESDERAERDNDGSEESAF